MARIVFIDLLFTWPPDGGARVDLKEIMTRLSARHEVTLLVPDFPDYFPRGRIEGAFPFNIRRLPFSKTTFNAWHLPRVFKKEVERIAPDRLFIADGWFLKFPLTAALRDHRPILRFYAYEGLCIKGYGTQFRDGAICPRCYLTDVFACTRCALRHHRFHPLDMFSHEFIGALGFTPLYRKWIGGALEAASTVIVYNSFMRDTLSRHHHDVRIIPSGVGTKAFFTQAPRGYKEPPVILMTSRTGDEGKGFSVLLKAIHLLKRRRLDFRVCIPTYGAVPHHEERMEYLPWHTQEELPQLYARADICVVPSVWREPFGIAAVEAMAAKKPVVASRCGGLCDIVDEGVTGFLVEPGNAVELAGRLEELLDNSRLRENMGVAGQKKVTKRYDWNIIIKEFYLPLLEYTEQ